MLVVEGLQRLHNVRLGEGLRIAEDESTAMVLCITQQLEEVEHLPGVAVYGDLIL